MRSMTGFGRGEARRDGVTWMVECGSVNRKQLELAVNLPRDLAELEGSVRGVVAAAVSRGRVNIIVRSESTASTGENAVQVDEALARQYHRALHSLALKLELPAEVTLQDLIRQPGVVSLQQTETSADTAWPAIEEALGIALRQMMAMREAEGAHLRHDIESRLQHIEEILTSIRERAATVPEHQRRVLRQRLEEAGVPLPLDDERLVKEIALFADRTDISEELSRAASHVKQFRAYLDSKEPAGRSLDFLLQEFFREFNTMGSKANNADIAHHVVTAKTELEKIREQVQNAE
ncbi:MAG: YicC family protein [Verrucomicrobiaceae bacterium]|nr:YicC family protein [Verrucomicrobiaceae bacterium]